MQIIYHLPSLTHAPIYAHFPPQSTYFPTEHEPYVLFKSSYNRKDILLVLKELDILR